MRMGPRLDADVLALLRAADNALSSNDIGLSLGVYNGRCWVRHGYQRTMEALVRLRDEGQVCKLPHEGVRNGATYCVCDGPAHAAEMQLATCEALIIDPANAEGARARLLRQALDGLRSTVSAPEARVG